MTQNLSELCLTLKGDKVEKNEGELRCCCQIAVSGLRVSDSANQVLHHVMDTCVRVAGAKVYMHVSV